MASSIDHTHDMRATSWVAEANDFDSPFPIQNLPLGSYRHERFGTQPRVGVAIGSHVLDLILAAEIAGFTGRAEQAVAACAEGRLNGLMSLSADCSLALRHAVFAALSSGYRGPDLLPALFPQVEVQMELPCAIGDFTDFFTSVFHAHNAGVVFRREVPVRPNFHSIPIGYHGRASSICVSGIPVRRPRGQVAVDGTPPVYRPSTKLDYEVELAILIRGENKLGNAESYEVAEDRIFGFCLFNDWSARDIQAFENQPLGPFLAKSFASTMSPWVVTREAMVPFRAPLRPRNPDVPPAPAHLKPAVGEVESWQIEIDCLLRSKKMRHDDLAEQLLSRSSVTDLHWSPVQMVVHQTSNGCNLRPGDLLATGTISGPERNSLGCLLELTSDGRDVLHLAGDERRYLADGDEVTLTGRSEADGFRWIGFGSASAIVHEA